MNLSKGSEPSSTPRMRLEKFLAQCGVASRRGSAELIRQGRVKVGGRVESRPGYGLSPGEQNTVSVDGRTIQAPASGDRLYLMVHKPSGYVTTLRDPEGRRTIMDLLPRGMPRVYPVGRLDYDSTGLLLMTNDGEWAQKVLHPRHEGLKRYVVWVEGRPSAKIQKDLLQGIPLADGPAQLEEMEFLVSTGDQSQWKIALREGRYREIRRLFVTVGHPAVSLHREAIGALTLGPLPVGKWRPLNSREIRAAIAPK